MLDTKKPLSLFFLKGETLKRFYDGTANVLSLANSFLTITYLSVFQYGLLQLLLSFVAIVDGLNIKHLDGPITVEMRHYFSKNEKDKGKRIFKEMVYWRLGFAIIISVVVFFGASVIAKFYGRDVSALVRLISPLFLIYALESIETIFFKSVISFSYWSFPAVRELSKLVILVGLLLFYQLSLTGVILAHIGGSVVALLTVTAAVFVRKYRETFSGINIYAGHLIFGFLKEHGQRIFLRYGLTRIVKSTMPWFIKFFVNTEAVAFYSLALGLVGFIESFMSTATIPYIFLLKLGNEKELAFIFRRAIKYSVWLGILFLILGFIFVPPVILLFFPQYGPAMPLFKIMILALPIYGSFKLMKSMLSTLREYQIMVRRLLNEALVIPIGSVILLPLFGVLGAGFVYIMTYLERGWFFYSQLVKKHPEFKLKFKNFFIIDAVDKGLFTKVISLLTGPIKRLFS